jgi:enamine deaminase RidA (YjgF/YER057c/UK114 family)
VAFDPQPVLTGDLLTLRPLRAEDWDALYAVASDPLLWAQHPAPDRYQPDVFRAFFDQAIASGGALVAIDNATGRVIGSSRYHGYDAAKGEVEIGWSFLARACWGGRYNGAMKRLMLMHAFASIPTVIFVIGVNNRRSQAAVEKIGGVRQPGTRPGAGGPSCVYTLTAATYAAPTREQRMSDRQSVSTGSPYEPIIGLARAVRIGNVVAVAGTAPLDADGKTVGKGDVAAQTTRCLDISIAALEKLGATRADVIRTRIFLTRIDDWRAAGEAHGAFFRDVKPVNTTMQVTRFIDPDWLVETEVDAIVSGG